MLSRFFFATIILSVISTNVYSEVNKKSPFVKKNKTPVTLSLNIAIPDLDKNKGKIKKKAYVSPVKSKSVHFFISKKTSKLKLFSDWRKTFINYGEKFLAIMPRKKFESLPEKLKRDIVLLKNPNLIRLNNTTINTDIAKAYKARNNTKQMLFLVKFAGPIKNSWRNEIASINKLTIIDYYPRNTLLVNASEGELEKLYRNKKIKKSIIWIGEYDVNKKKGVHIPSDKNTSNLSQEIDLTIEISKKLNYKAALNLIQKIAVKIYGEPYETNSKLIIRIRLKPAHIDKITSQPAILNVNKYFPPSGAGESDALIVANKLQPSGFLPALPGPVSSISCLGNDEPIKTNRMLPTDGYLSFLCDNFNFDDANAFTTFNIDIAGYGVDGGQSTGVLADLHPAFTLNGAGATSRLIYSQSISPILFSSTGISTTAENTRDINGHETLVASVAAGYNNGPNELAGTFTDSSDYTITPSTTGPLDQDTNNYHFSLGIAPYARIGNTRLFNDVEADGNFVIDPSATTISIALEAAYTNNARISNHSWGGSSSPIIDNKGTPDPSDDEVIGYSNCDPVSNTKVGNATYDATALIFDNHVRDADSNNSNGYQQLSIVSSAGNTGFLNAPSDLLCLNTLVTGQDPTICSAICSSENYGLQTNSIWLGAPVAKNVITVGASEGVDQTSDPDRFPESHCTPLSQVGSAQDWHVLSSRGPTADGRFKPDLVAPGTRIYGAIPQHSTAPTAPITEFNTLVTDDDGCRPYHYPPTNPEQALYRRDTGTSFAAPAVSGAAALLKQRFIDNKNNNPTKYMNIETMPALPNASPSPALIKAWLMNTTTYISNPGASGLEIASGSPGHEYDLPSNIQGMGRLNIERALDLSPRLIRDQLLDFDNSTNPTYEISGVITDNPFRVTLVWTDAAGSGLKNDLDLSLCINSSAADCSGGALFRGNNFILDVSQTGGSADSDNNVESIWSPSTIIVGAGVESIVGKPFTVRVIPTSIMGDSIPGNGPPDDPSTEGVDESITFEQDFALIIYNTDLSLVSHGVTNPLTVNEGSTTVLSTSDLSITNHGVDNSNIVFTVTNLPTNGAIQLSGVALPTNGTFTQQDILNNLVTYAHSGSETLSDSFMFTVTDGYGATSGTTETFNISITPQDDPTTFAGDDAITVDEMGTVVITATDLMAVDAEITDPTQLVYNVTLGATPGIFQIGAVDVTSFTQAQIDAGDVSYLHDGSETPLNYNIPYTVTAGAVISPSQNLTVTVTPQDDPTTFSGDDAITVDEMGSVGITATDLMAVDAEITDLTQLIYNVTLGATPGTFQIGAADVTSFTQAQIDAGDVSYVHDGSETPLNYNIPYTVTAGAVISPSQNLAVTVTPQDDPTTFLADNAITVDEMGSVNITMADLEAIDAEITDPTQLVYNVTLGATPGTFQISAVDVTSFTQAQVNAGNVVSYVHDGSETPLNYNIPYTVTAGAVISPSQNLAVTVTPQDDPTTFSGDDAITVDEMGSVGITATDLMAVDAEITDPTQLVYNVTLGATPGTFQIGAVDVTSFTQAQINAGNVVSYVHDGSETPLNYNIPYTVTAGGIISPSQNLAVTVTPQNDPPTSSDTFINILEGSGTSHTFDSSEFPYPFDAESDLLNQIRITNITIPVGSTLQLSAVNVSDADIILVAQIANLVFTPAAGAMPINNYASFDFEVHDGNDFSTPVNTMTIHIIPSAAHDPLDVVIVADTSGSMNGISAGSSTPDTKIKLLSLSVRTFIDMWSPMSVPGDRIGLVLFNSSPQPYMGLGSLLVTGNDANMQNISNFVCDVNAIDPDICDRVGGGGTAMGGGIQSAITALRASDPDENNNQNIIVFTDGMQNGNPLVVQTAADADGDTYEIAGDANKLGNYNDNEVPKTLRIHTIGTGVINTTSWQTLLAGISSETSISAMNLAHNAAHNDAASDLPSDWIDSLITALNTNTLQKVAHEQGSTTRDSVVISHPFSLNSTAERVNFSVMWIGDQKKDTMSFTLRKGKKKITVTPANHNVQIMRKGSHTVASAIFPVKADDGSMINATGDWFIDIKSNTEQTLNYNMWVIADDSGVKYEFIPPTSTSTVGDRLSIKIRLLSNRKPIQNKVTATLIMKSPKIGEGSFLSRNKVNRKKLERFKVKHRPTLTLAEKKGHFLLRNEKLAKEYLTPVTKKISLFDDGDLKRHGDEKAGDGIYSALTPKNRIPGKYRMELRIQGETEKNGTVKRVFNASSLVALKNICRRQSIFTVTKIKHPSASHEIRVTPKDCYENYLGPGNIKDIITKIPKGMKIGDIIDNLDGSYSLLIKASIFTKTPIGIKIRNVEFIKSIGPRIPWWWGVISIILISIATLLIRRKIKSIPV